MREAARAQAGTPKKFTNHQYFDQVSLDSSRDQLSDIQAEIRAGTRPYDENGFENVRTYHELVKKKGLKGKALEIAQL